MSKHRNGFVRMETYDNVRKELDRAQRERDEACGRITRALNIANGRWSEWGDRALQVEAALTNPEPLIAIPRSRVRDMLIEAIIVWSTSGDATSVVVDRILSNYDQRK